MDNKKLGMLAVAMGVSLFSFSVNKDPLRAISVFIIISGFVLSGK